MGRKLKQIHTWFRNWIQVRYVATLPTFPPPHTHSNALLKPKVIGSNVAPWQLHSPVSAMRYLGHVPVVVLECGPPSTPLRCSQDKSHQLVERWVLRCGSSQLSCAAVPQKSEGKQCVCIGLLGLTDIIRGRVFFCWESHWECNIGSICCHGYRVLLLYGNLAIVVD